MTAAGRQLRHDPDTQMTLIVERTIVDFPEEAYQALNPGYLDDWIGRLREGEASVRKMRKRLEALQRGTRKECPECGRPVVGRSDSRYCSPRCRVRAHRAKSSDHRN